MAAEVKKLSAAAFRPYGKLIEYPGKEAKSRKVNLFRIVVREVRPLGWRIAYLIVRDRLIGKLEQHPHSWESFEPLAGRSVLYVSSRRNQAGIRCFLLDRPVVVRKGIWHGVVAVTREAEIKLTENNKVGCVYWKLPFKLDKNGQCRQ